MAAAQIYALPWFFLGALGLAIGLLSQLEPETATIVTLLFVVPMFVVQIYVVATICGNHTDTGYRPD